MNPRGYWDVFTFTAAVTGLAFASAWAALLKWPFTEAIIPGALFGITMAAVGASKLQGATRQIPVAAPQDFAARLNVACAELGYEPAATADGFFTYAPNQQSSYSIGPIKVAPAGFLRLAVQLHGNMATLVGPKELVEKLVARLEGQV